MSTETAYPATGLLHAYVLDGNGGGNKLDWAGVRAWSPADGPLWINVDYTIDDAASWLASHANIPALVRDGLLDVDPRPRAVVHDGNLQLIVRGINVNRDASPEDMLSVRAWVESRRIVTLRHRVSRSLESIAADLERGAGPRDASDVATVLVERMLEHLVTRVDELGDDVAAAEDRSLDDPRGELRAQLADHRRRAIALRRFLGPQREAFAKLPAINAPWLDADRRGRFAECADRMTRTIEELDAARDRAAVTQEELASRVAELTNRRLYLLAIISVIFIPLAFVTSLLGVNFAVPFAGEAWAFWTMIGVFVVGVSVELWWFRRRGWL